jgi:hypothetical protein
MNLSELLILDHGRLKDNPKIREGLHCLYKQDFAMGEKLIKEAAFEGESNGFIILGYLMERQNNVQAMEEYYLKASQMGNPAGLYHLGKYYFEKGELGKGRDFFIDAYESGVSQSSHYLEKIQDKKDRDYYLFILLGPFFLIKKREYEAAFWCVVLLGIVSLISHESITIFSFLLSFLVINLFFSESYDRHNL